MKLNEEILKKIKDLKLDKFLDNIVSFTLILFSCMALLAIVFIAVMEIML